MRLHSNVLTADDVFAALTAANLDGVSFDTLVRHDSRSHGRAFEFRLEATPKPGRRRRRNTGCYGAEDAGQPIWTAAATWDEHGAFFARVFAKDPDAWIGPYKGLSDFTRQTQGKYLLTEHQPVLS